MLTGLVVAVALLFSANPAGAMTSHHKPSKSQAAKVAGDKDRNSHRHSPLKHAKSPDQAREAAARKAAAHKTAARNAAARKAAARKAA
ncbi:MAG: hypothetical protein QOE71_2962, partial [Pseudonocardiales bacterium]|nr:hypothetical protein [Pseudonocardiales bacterium]